MPEMAEQALINDPTALLVFFAGFVALIFALAQTPAFEAAVPDPAADRLDSTCCRSS